MQVSIKFDTEKESLDDLKRLVGSLQELITKREQNKVVVPQATVTQMQQPMPQPVQQSLKPQQASSHTTGGGRIMEYDPAVGDLLSKFAMGR